MASKKFEEALAEAMGITKEVREVAESLVRWDATTSVPDIMTRIDDIEASAPEVIEKADAEIGVCRKKIAELESQIKALEDALSLPKEFLEGGSDLLRQQAANKTEEASSRTIREILGVTPEPSAATRISLGARVGRAIKGVGTSCAEFSKDFRNEFRQTDKNPHDEDEGGGDDEH